MLNDRVVAWDWINRARNEPKLIREKFHSIGKKKSHDIKLTHLRKFGDFGMCGLCKSCCSMKTRVSAMKSDDSRCNFIILNGATLSHQMHIIFCMSALRFSFASKWLDKRAPEETKQQSLHMSSSCRPSTRFCNIHSSAYTTPRLAFSIGREKEKKVGIRHREKEESLLTFRQNTEHSDCKDINAKAQRVIQSPRLNLKSPLQLEKWANQSE